jgi:surface protein
VNNKRGDRNWRKIEVTLVLTLFALILITSTLDLKLTTLATYSLEEGSTLYINGNTFLQQDTYEINLETNESLVVFNASNVYLDCDNSTLNGDGNGIAVFNPGFANITIRNCNIDNYEYSIYVDGPNTSITLENNDLETTYYTREPTVLTTIEGASSWHIVGDAGDSTAANLYLTNELNNNLSLSLYIDNIESPVGKEFLLPTDFIFDQYVELDALQSNTVPLFFNLPITAEPSTHTAELMIESSAHNTSLPLKVSIPIHREANITGSLAYVPENRDIYLYERYSDTPFNVNLQWNNEADLDLYVYDYFSIEDVAHSASLIGNEESISIIDQPGSLFLITVVNTNSIESTDYALSIEEQPLEEINLTEYFNTPILNITDETDLGNTIYPFEPIAIYATYTYNEASVSDAFCDVIFEDSEHEMDYFNVSDGFYMYADKTFSSPGEYGYNVACSHQDFATVEETDTLTISAMQPLYGVQGGDPSYPTTPVLNSTYGTNTTDENLTVYYYEGAENKTIINWFVNGAPLLLLNTPFEGGSNSTFTRDYSNSSYNGSVINTTWNASGGYDGNGSYEFNGTGYINFGDVLDINNNDFALEAWFKTNSSANMRIISKMENAAAEGEYYLGTSNGNISVKFMNTGVVDAYVTDSANTSDGQWHHVIASFRQSGDIILYVDGVQKDTTTMPGGQTETSGPLLIGAAYEFGYGDFFTGSIDEAKMYNASLNPEQVLAIYNNRTDLIVSDSTQEGYVLQACVTPNNGTHDGDTTCSNTLTIQEAPEQSDYFTFQINTTSPSQNFTFYAEDASLTVNWTDGNVTYHSGTDIITHLYDTAGIHNISINGTATRIAYYYYYDDTTPELLHDILTPVSDGVTGITSSQQMFYDTNVSNFTATDFFDETSANVTDMSGMFVSASFNQSISNWDVSKVTDMAGMFQYSDFDQDIGNWNVSSVTNMASMFSGFTEKKIFNQDISNWDVSNVQNMNYMFYDSSFNQNISSWNVSNVTSMRSMFERSDFNQNLSSWDVSKVTDMFRMFSSSNFNSSIADWNVSSVEDMEKMFNGISEFNQNISNWDVSHVTTMSDMFHSTDFNQDLGSWNTSNVAITEGMFYNTPFNQNISAWDVHNVTDMGDMFLGTPFNQSISSWNVSNVQDMGNMFAGSAFNQDIGSWDVSSVTDMNSMFYTSYFNQDISDWNVSSVQDMSSLFRSSYFNQGIDAWDVSNVTTMASMFRDSSFNQSIGNWNVSSVTDFSYMFQNSDFDQDVSNWDVSSATDLRYMFSGAQLSTPNYDALLSGWSSLPSLNYNLSFHGGTSDYCLGEAARNNTLIDIYNWSITDGGQNCSGMNIITGQTNITQSGYYYLANDLMDATDEYFINISANNVVLNCNGKTIDGSDHDGYGIYIYRDSQEWTNITINNCTISDWGTGSLTDESGIYLKNIENISLLNLNISSNFNGIIMENSDNNYIYGTTTNDNTDNGLFFSSSNSNIIRQTDSKRNGGYGVELFISTNSFYNIYLDGNDEGINFISSTNNIIANSTINDSRFRDISIYSTADSHCVQTFTNVTGLDGKALLYYNQLDNLSNQNNNISSITLCRSHNSALENITIDGRNITGSPIYIFQSENVTLNNITVSGGFMGLEISEGSNNSIYNIDANSTNGAFRILSSNNAYVENAIVSGDLLAQSDYGTYINISGRTGEYAELTLLGTDNIVVNPEDLVVDDDGDAEYNTIIFNNTFGQIRWNASILHTTAELSVGSNIFVENNKAGILDNSELLYFNSSAQIEIRNLAYSETPWLLKDGTRCDDTEVCNISYSGTTLYANVSSFSNYTTSEEPYQFIFQINTTASPQNFSFQVDDADLTIDWGDGNTTNYNGTILLNHTFATAGIYNISVNGSASRIAFSKYYDIISQEATPELLIDVLTPVSDGVTGIIDASEMFAFTNITTFTATDFFDITSQNVTDMGSMFHRSQFNQNISNWDVSDVTDMSSMFSYTPFDQSINSWNVSSVETMGSMFDSAADFNQDLSNWDVSSLTVMGNMFRNADLFNGNISTWDVSNVTDMRFVFISADSFNQSINNWDVSSVTQMDGLFSYATSFNQDLDSWNVSNVLDMNQMFRNAAAFNNNISTWNVSNVENMNNMFYNSPFNQSIADWDVSNVTTMQYAFGYSDFNQNISAWNVSSVIYMNFMFKDSDFNQEIGDWDVSNVEYMDSMFSETPFNQNISAWDVSNVTTMRGLFASTPFNWSIANWDVSNVEDMEIMFYSTPFNKNISNWNVSSVTDMKQMFQNSDFNQDIGGWNVSNVQDMSYMLRYSDFNQDIGAWDVSNVTTMTAMLGSTPFDQNISAWNVSSVNDFTDMFQYAQLSTSNYDSLLTGWASLSSLNQNLSFHGGNSQYCNGESARNDTLIGVYNWTITDGGKNCSGQEAPAASNQFIFQINTTASPQNFSFQVDDANLTVNWGDGNTTSYSGTGLREHEYATAGVYNISLNGTASRISYYEGTGDLLIDILTPISDGVAGITSAENMFRETNVDSFTASDFLDTISVNITSMLNMFYGSSFNQSIANWDVSNVTDMIGMFRNSGFDQNISAWNVSSVKYMRYMFYNSNFNQNISEWDVSNVIHMNGMFADSPFNRDISNWDVSNVTNMQYMFTNTNFNQDLGSWNVSKVGDMRQMFFAASNFNQDIGSWDVSAVSDMSWMFYVATNFNQDINSWDVSNVTNMSDMFRNSGFDQNISAWNVSGVRDFRNMFNQSSLSISNYDALLIGWSSLPELNYNLSFHGGNSQYCNGESARNDTLIDFYNWSITDGGKNCTAEEQVCDVYCDSCSSCDTAVATPNRLVCLNTSIFNYTDSCIVDVESNVTLDCQGYAITGNRSVINTYGIQTSSGFNQELNITIQNCSIRNFSNEGIELKTNRSIIQDTQLINNANGINIGGSHHNTLERLTVMSNSTQGITLAFGSSNNTFRDIYFENSGYSNNMVGAYNNILTDITIINASIRLPSETNSIISNAELHDSFLEISTIAANLTIQNISLTFSELSTTTAIDITTGEHIFDNITIQNTTNPIQITGAELNITNLTISHSNTTVNWPDTYNITTSINESNFIMGNKFITLNSSNITELENKYAEIILNNEGESGCNLTKTTSYYATRNEILLYGLDCQSPACNISCENNQINANISGFSGYAVGNATQQENYTLTITIDGIESTTFNQTAHPYEVTIHAENNQVALENATIGIAELFGNNIFAAQTSLALTEALTDENGNATFIIAPTHYPTIENYALEVELVVDDQIKANESFTITNNASLVFTDKYLTPSNLADNSKTTVNSMASIADSLFIWTNTLEQAILLNMTVYSNGTYEGVQTIQTGAPNVINVTLKATNGTPIDGYVTIKEVGGYLMFNPTNNPPSIGAKNHTHEYEEINTTEQFIITPTEYGGIDSNITLTIYNSTDDVVTEINLTVNQSLEPRSGSSYASDELKVIVNSLNSVVNHLYEALN